MVEEERRNEEAKYGGNTYIAAWLKRLAYMSSAEIQCNNARENV
jgi:hypothetical protein